MAAVERGKCVGRCADLRLIAVDDVRDDGEDDEVDAAQTPQAFPKPRVVYALVDEAIAVVDALMRISALSRQVTGARAVATQDSRKTNDRPSGTSLSRFRDLLPRA